MKIPRIVTIFLIAIFSIIASWTIWNGLTSGSRGFGRGAAYGNLWINYNWQERGILEDQVNWLIAAPNQIKAQGFSGDDNECYVTFKSGNTFRFPPDSENLIWVDPIEGAKTVPVGSSRKFIEGIERSREKAQGQEFKSPEELIGSVKK